MKEIEIERIFLCTLIGTNHVAKCKARYILRELDDRYQTLTMVHDTLEILDQQEGHA